VPFFFVFVEISSLSVFLTTSKDGEVMKVSRIVIFILVIFLLPSCASKKYQHGPIKSPSLLDIPEKGLYYGFIVNSSSHFIEVVIWSMKEKRKVYHSIVLPPSRSHMQKNIRGVEYWHKYKHELRAPNVFPLWLKLDTYKVSIRNRDDVIDEGPPGTDKTFMVVLDKEHVKHSPGPFTFEIEDD